jgi:tetratricopeptide (TPR) repeat protein
MLGPDHPDVATALNTLTLAYANEGRNDEAEPLYKRALAIREKAVGPDHPDVAMSNLALLYSNEGRYAEAELLFKRALTISEKTLGAGHPFVVDTLNDLADLYSKQGRYADALPLVRRAISNKSAATWAALPVLFGAQAAKLISVDEALDNGLNVVQRALQTSAGQALNALAVRFAAGNDQLAQLVRKDQDLSGEAASLNKATIAAVSSEPAKRDAAAEKRLRDRITAIAKERDDLQSILKREFPDYAALSDPGAPESHGHPAGVRGRRSADSRTSW